MNVFCTLMKNGVDYMVENQQEDGPDWVHYGILAGNMPGVNGFVFVARDDGENPLRCFDAKTFITIDHFQRSVAKIL